MPEENSEGRFTRPEHGVAQLREQVTLAGSDAAAARVLAAGADRDVSEVRAELYAHTRGLNALQEVQSEQSRAIDEVRAELRAQAREMRQGFATLAIGMAQITALLTDIRDAQHDGA